MHTWQRTRKIGQDNCAQLRARADGAGRGAAWEGSESRVPEWGSVAGSPDRRRDGIPPGPFQPEGEKLWEREAAQDTRCQAV